MGTVDKNKQEETEEPVKFLFESIVGEDYTEKYRIEAFTIKNTHIASLIPHRNIINAIKSRDAEAAQKAMMSHLNIAQSNLSSSQSD